MTTLLDIRNEVVRQIRAGIKDAKIEVAAHPGRFDEKELRRLMTKTPAILTSFLFHHDGCGADESYIDFASWVLYRASNKDRLYDGGLDLVSRLVPVIRNIDADWAFAVEKIETENLFTGTLDNLNVTLWAVSWRWKIRGSAIDGDDAGIIDDSELDYFDGADATILVGNESVGHITNVEVKK